MEEGKKKVMIVVVVACLVAAGIITYATRSRRSGGIESIERGEMIWLKCRNPKCENEWQMDMRDYFEYIKEHQNPRAMALTAVVCPKCNEESGYRAEKCENCGLVFERGTVPQDFADKCPKCGHSKEERLSKEAGGGEE